MSHVHVKVLMWHISPVAVFFGLCEIKTLLCVWPPLYLTGSLSCSNVLSVPGKKGRVGMLCVLLTLLRPFCLALICSSSACDLCCWKQIPVTLVLKRSHTDKRKLPGPDYIVTHRPALGFPKASLESCCSAFTPEAVGAVYLKPEALALHIGLH